MFLLSFPVPGSAAHRLVFCLTDPREAGYGGPVEAGVELECGGLCDSSWRASGGPRVAGRSVRQPARFRVFESDAACRAAGFRPVGPTPVVVSRWAADVEAELTRTEPGGHAGAATVALGNRPAAER